MVPILGHGLWTSPATLLALHSAVPFRFVQNENGNTEKLLGHLGHEAKSKDSTHTESKGPGLGQQLAQAGPSDIELEAAKNLQVRAHSR